MGVRDPAPQVPSSTRSRKSTAIHKNVLADMAGEGDWCPGEDSNLHVHTDTST